MSIGPSKGGIGEDLQLARPVAATSRGMFWPKRPAYQVALAVIAVVLCESAPAGAAGFFLQEQSVRGIGRANAGAAAVADDPSTIFYNPAGLTQLPKTAVAVGGHLIIPQSTVKDRGSTIATPATAGTFVPVGGADGKPSEPAAVPNAYVSTPVVDERLWLGLGVTSPFGSKTEYKSDYFGRYDATKSRLLTVDIMPTVAVAVTDWLSIGAGLDIQYAEVDLVRAIPNPMAVGGPTPATDGRSSVSGNSWAVGYNVGVLLKPFRGTQIGLHYRSAVDHDLQGRAEGSQFRAPLAALNRSADASATLKLPNIVSVGAAVDVTDDLKILGQVSWFGWSRLYETRIKVKGDARDRVITQAYRNTVSVAVGAEYEVDDAWTVRGGFQYDPTPTTDAHRSTRLPDADRYWLSAGFSYKLSERVAFDAAYAHLFVNDASIDRSEPFFSGTPLASTLQIRGESVGSNVNILSLQVRAEF